MQKAQLIYVLGDVHGDWRSLNTFINKELRHSREFQNCVSNYAELEAILLQCGDFGFWPHKHGKLDMDDRRKPWDQYGIKNAVSGIKDGLVKIYWCDGNHENHDALDRLEELNPGKPFIPIMEGVYYAAFGSVLKLLDGTRVMFCGGAESIDKFWRVPGESWWKQECIDSRDMARLPDPAGDKIDWVVSHTCPSFFRLGKLGNGAKEEDPSKGRLDEIFTIYRPRRWWFGHYHGYLQGRHKDCLWTLLSGSHSGKRWWEALPLLKKDTR
ncbi:MAG: metallophosphoesterase [Deltaproteobacteria bacterium]|jgi:hypothetical protein|nr:metallophosphoesterase [Deltaproteobacteria bacterium]